MRDFLAAIFFALCVIGFLSLPAQATPPTYYGNIVAPLPSPLPGSTFNFAGDSITYGLGINNQTTYGCSHYTYPSPCFADQISSFFGVTEANYGGVGACLESTTTSGSICNPATFDEEQLITSYLTNQLPYAGNNNTWFWIQIGTNDVAAILDYNDTQVNVATFQSDYSTIVAALENAGTPGNQIVLSEIPWFGIVGEQSTNPQSNFFISMIDVMAFNNAIAQVAQKYHTRLSLTYNAYSMCTTNISESNTCTVDQVHPNNTGHAAIAAMDELATTLNAYTAASSYQAGGIFNSAYVVADPYYKNFQAPSITTTTGGSIFGTAASNGALSISTSYSGATSGIYTLGTSIVNGVSGVIGQCGTKQVNSTLIQAQDCAGDFGVLGESRSNVAVVAGYLAANMPPYSAGDLVAHRSAGCGSVSLGSINSPNYGTLDYGCTTASTFTASAAFNAPQFNSTTRAPACSGTSTTPCTFSWTCTMSSGACTATQAVPSSSSCGLTPNVTPVISTTDVATYWATLASTTLTVHVQDQLGTASSAFSGVGTCL